MPNLVLLQITKISFLLLLSRLLIIEIPKASSARQHNMHLLLKLALIFGTKAAVVYGKYWHKKIPVVIIEY